MVSFARARTRSLLSMLWPVTTGTINNDKAQLAKSKELIEKQQKQNKCFLKATENGGMWFS
tara:strand:+ start:4894 stop:5076 length:183 start_codon:yes stop_codon:yes gene_type:complete